MAPWVHQKFDDTIHLKKKFLCYISPEERAAVEVKRHLNAEMQCVFIRFRPFCVQLIENEVVIKNTQHPQMHSFRI